MNNVIYYFTGTGNSLAIAKDIARQLGDTKLLNMRYDQQELDATNYERVGIVFPDYYMKMPLFVESFLKKIKFSPNQYIFGVVTYGSTRGLTLAGLREIIKEKGYSVNGEFSVMMPGNNIVEYGAIPAKINNFIIASSKKKVAKISNAVAMKKDTEPLGPRAFERIYLSRDSSKQYIIDKRNDFKNMDKGFKCEDSCNGCGTCEKLCPVNNIRMQNGHPQWEHRCEQCKACIQWCNKKSINYMNKTQKRNYYHHNDISLKDMLSLEE